MKGIENNFEENINEYITDSHLERIGYAFRDFTVKDAWEVGNSVLGSKVIKIIHFSYPAYIERTNEFIKKFSRDYALLQTDEERGSYILKLAAYSTLLIFAFQTGSIPVKKSYQRDFILKAIRPLLHTDSSYSLIEKIIKKTEKKISKEAANEIRKFVNTLNTSIVQEMPIQDIAETLIQLLSNNYISIDS